ncbi:glutathione S-transferase 1 [Plutella xylostella]|uniref:glutathione S-transferase 1 n=1 Tax=Plutella xylostella TaxID=51655 RepID=UPI0020327D1D|nr:glutathione S-transferase 1 [Plutella xylostella]
MPLILYVSDASPPARAVLMLAEILQLEFDKQYINPVLREQDSPEMTQKNPMRTVPTLEDGEFCLADSHAIILYLMEKYGQNHRNLYPEDLRVRSTIHQRLFFDCSILFPRLRAIMAPTFLGKLNQPSGSMVTNIEDAYRTLEAYLSQSKYLAGPEMTIADISAVATVCGLDGLHPIDEKRHPNTREWLVNMSRKPFYRKCNAEGNEMLISLLKSSMKNNKQNDKKAKL